MPMNTVYNKLMLGCWLPVLLSVMVTNVYIWTRVCSLLYLMEESRISPSLSLLGRTYLRWIKKVVTLTSDRHGDKMLEALKDVTTKCSEVKAIFRSPFHGYLFSA